VVEPSKYETPVPKNKETKETNSLYGCGLAKVDGKEEEEIP
jgi:hypothetical protein